MDRACPALADITLRADRSYLVGLSGGADSVALLLLLKEAREAGRIGDLAACHVNHGIRGGTAKRDEAFCKALCDREDIPFAVVRADVPAAAKEKGISIETAAREIRYAALETARAEANADFIAVAHHRGDQAETVLMHLIRGCGLKGLTGMRYISGAIVRPLLDQPKEALTAYLEGRGQDWMTDETNFIPDAARNRVRLELLPLLKSFNPGIEEALCRMAKTLSSDEAYLSREAEKSLSRYAGDEGLSLDAASLPEPLLSRILFSFAGQAGMKDLTSLDESLMEETVKAGNGAKRQLHGGYTALAAGGRLTVGKETEAERKTPLPREGRIEDLCGTFIVSRIRADDDLPWDGRVACLDADLLPEDLALRTRRAGDRFHPLGAPGEKSLSDFYTDKKASAAQRAIPVLASGSEVFWVPGMTVSERAKVTPATINVLRIDYRKE